MIKIHRRDAAGEPRAHHHGIGAEPHDRLGNGIKGIEERAADELVVLQARNGKHPGLPQLRDGAHLGHRRRGVGRGAEEARGVGSVPEGGIHQRAVDAERRVIGVDRHVDPEIGVEEERRREEALAVLILGRFRRDPLGLLLGKDRVEALRERRIVEPHGVVIAVRLEHVHRIARERRFARDERRQVAGHAKTQGIETDEENILIGEATLAQGDDHALDHAEGRREARTGVGVDLEAHFLLGAGDELAPRLLLKGRDHLLDDPLVGGVIEAREARLPDRSGSRLGRRLGWGSGIGCDRRVQKTDGEKRESKQAHAGLVVYLKAMFPLGFRDCGRRPLASNAIVQICPGRTRELLRRETN